MGYDAVVFDNDGVLTTPTPRSALRRAIANAFASVGVEDPTDDCVRTLRSPDLPSLRAVARRHGVDPAELWAARDRAAIALQEARIRDGRKRLYDDVAALDDLAVPRAIVSNNQHETIENVVEGFGLDGFDPCYGRRPTLEDLERKKPDPHYVERAIDDLGAENPLYVGDSRVDVAAARACGIDVAFVRREHREGYRLETDPTHEIDSLTSLAGIV